MSSLWSEGGSDSKVNRCAVGDMLEGDVGCRNAKGGSPLVDPGEARGVRSGGPPATEVVGKGWGTGESSGARLA